MLERAFNLAGEYNIRFSIVNTNAYSDHHLSVTGGKFAIIEILRLITLIKTF
jgi:hypothetical protein